MVRGEAILFILSILVQQLNTGSVFDQFSAPDKKDKNKMLMYMRGLLKLDPKTTPKPRTTPAPTLEQVWDGKSLPDRSDKTQMLAYLRGLKAPNSILSVYEEPQHHGLIQTLQSPDTAKNTAQDTENIQDKQNVVVDSSETHKESQDSWANPATQITILQPSEQESESDTCFWRGQEVMDQDLQLVQNKEEKDKYKKGGKKKNPKNENKAPVQENTQSLKPATDAKTTGFSFEQVGENIVAFWECMKKKFFKSYARLQNKICSVF